MFHDWFKSARVMKFSQSIHKYSKIITRVVFQSLNERFDQLRVGFPGAPDTKCGLCALDLSEPCAILHYSSFTFSLSMGPTTTQKTLCESAKLPARNIIGCCREDLRVLTPLRGAVQNPEACCCKSLPAPGRKRKMRLCRRILLSGGEGGIRTRG